MQILNINLFRLNIEWLTLSLVMVAILNLLTILLSELYWKCILKLDEKRRLKLSFTLWNYKITKFYNYFLSLNEVSRRNRFRKGCSSIQKTTAGIHILQKYYCKKMAQVSCLYLDITIYYLLILKRRFNGFLWIFCLENILGGANKTQEEVEEMISSGNINVYKSQVTFVSVWAALFRHISK